MKIRVGILMIVLLQTTLLGWGQAKYKLKLQSKIYCPKFEYRNVCAGNNFQLYAIGTRPTAIMPLSKELLDDGTPGHNLRYIESTCATVPWVYNDSITFDATQRVGGILLYSKTDESGWGGCSMSCEDTKTWTTDHSTGSWHAYNSAPYTCYNSSTEIWIAPDRIDLSVPTGENYLPSADQINIVATAGFPAGVYNWQYNIGGNSGWQDFPSSTNAAGKSSIMLSGYDLLGSAFDFLGTQNVFIRVKAADWYASDPLILKPTIPAPHITSLAPVPNKCFGDANGTVIVQFDRALLPGETLNILLNDTINGQGYSAFNLTALSAGNTYTFPAQFGPGGFKIELIGNYNSVPTYTSGPGHIGRTGFTGPAAVSFTTSFSNVHCYAGADGIIGLEAAGGQGVYWAAVKKATDPDYRFIALNDAANRKHTVTGLEQGDYLVRLYDVNNCIMKDGAGNEVIVPITISQPADPLTIDYRQRTNPLAYGYTDGSVMAILVGGTPQANGSYTVSWIDSASNATLSTVQNSNNPFTTTLQQVGEGAYILTATDANYALVTAGSAAGCVVTDTFRLQQPAPLVVTIEESHYVTCKGISDGALHAIASGGIEIPAKRYTYQWFKNNNGNWTDIGQTDSIAKQLATGTYKVIITDKNNITKESDTFRLAEPEELIVALTSTPVVCSGDRNGGVAAAITGGTIPYSIQWSTGDTTVQVTGLPQGNYLAYVNDSRGCRNQQQVKIITPNPIAISNLVVQPPVCAGDCNGSILYNVSGGAGNYTWLWNDGNTDQYRAGICAGNYAVTITDTKGCFLQRSFTIQDAAPVTIELGPDRTLCTGQSWLADAAIADAGATYRWSSANGFTATTASVSLTNAGSYAVQVTDSKGCTGGDAITITKSDAVVAADFVASTQAFKGELVTFVNISQPWPETTQWILPSGSTTTVDKRTDSLLQLRFTDTGTYRITLRTGVGACTKEYSNSITIVEGQSFNDPGTTTDPFILEFTVAPNPSNGQFQVNVAMQDMADISLRLMNLQTGATVDQRRLSGSSKYTVPYNIRVVSGVYVLVLETAKDSRVFRVLIL